MINKILLVSISTIISFLHIKGQEVNMYFPKFSGKSYDFVIFQGADQKIIYQGVIPDDGKFVLSIPKIYGIYTGMSRWLITGTEEGGGLDMFIPGRSFSVSCKESVPNKENIIYLNNLGNDKLDSLYESQEKIISRYRSMQMAIDSYNASFAYYSLFKTEYNKQKSDYAIFQKELRNNKDYISCFLSIINITRGFSGELEEKENEKARDIAQYISHGLDWSILYTSGHWSSVIESWIDIHLNVLKDSSIFVREFKSISERILSKKIYVEFAQRVYYYLERSGRNDYLNMIDHIKELSTKRKYLL